MSLTDLHPWNKAFDWIDAAPRSGFLTGEQINSYNENGYVVIEDAVTDTELKALTVELDKLSEETDAFLRTLDEGRLSIAESGAIIFGIHPSTRYETARAFVSNQIFLDITYDLIGPDVRLYWDQIVYKQTEKPRRFPWHQDNGYGFVQPQQYLTCWVPLVDATVDNGCPWIVPSVHKSGTLNHTYLEPLGYECFTEHPNAMPVEAKAGSIVIFSSLTPHMTGPNRTTETRKAYIIQYASDGSYLLKGEPEKGEPETREPATDPNHQFLILENGKPPR